MKVVEIEKAVSALAAAPFERGEFAYAFLEAFDNNAVTIKKLRTGTSNSSDIGGVLQRNNIHIKTCAPGTVAETLDALRDSPATARAKARFILATDGDDFQAEDLNSGELVVCEYPDLPEHFWVFLPLAKIETVRQASESTVDTKATRRLNRLYIELLKDNPDWGMAERRAALNQFMARLIFCLFAEDTDIFTGEGLFTATIRRMSESDSANTHEVIGTLFRAMNTGTGDRAGAKLPRWADAFPHVNGGLFSGGTEVPRFSKTARSHLLKIGDLDWKAINPDIFGSMIQTVADDAERGALGMHYTSVPNILKVLNPLFLDDLREKLAEAGENARKLLNLRNRIARIRVFDPACGSGNFLVIAYKEMRALEAEINRRRREGERKSDIPLTNFRGIEIRAFPAEIARLALIIAEYQCDVAHRGQKEALRDFLPLDAMNWITHGNALRLDWLSVCPPGEKGVKLSADDLLHTPVDQARVDFENAGGETYICGNPPYLGSALQSKEQKEDLRTIFDGRAKKWKSLDYVGGWFMKAADFATHTKCSYAFVTTNSICQGEQVPILWPLIFGAGHEIAFAYSSFKWSNLASHNAGVTVAIVCVSSEPRTPRRLFSMDAGGRTIMREVKNINSYLVGGSNNFVNPIPKTPENKNEMKYGNKPTDDGNFFINTDERDLLLDKSPEIAKFIRKFLGAQEFMHNQQRYCLWIEDDQVQHAMSISDLKRRIEKVRNFRLKSKKAATVQAADWPHSFGERRAIRRSGDHNPNTYL